ncbi:hypothetical protein [Arsenophonus apicola]|uniref:hypothetical protein n=1 Tax=Arsenophonus apicola TaxID=2879119 RepID=UPI00387A4CDC
MKAQPKILFFSKPSRSELAHTKTKHQHKKQSNNLLCLANKPLYPTTQKSLTNRG